MKSKGREKKNCRIICIYELRLYLDCSSFLNHHFDYLFQWQHKWITLQQPFPYIFIHLFFVFVFIFIFCICVFVPTCRSLARSSADANIVAFTIGKNIMLLRSYNCADDYCFCATKFKIRTHTHSLLHIFIGWNRNGWMLFFFVVIVIVFLFFFIFSPNDKLFVRHQYTYVCVFIGVYSTT